MAWTAPKTFTSGALTSAELNEQLRDNMLAIQSELADWGILVGGGSNVLSALQYAQSASGSSLSVASGSDTVLTLDTLDINGGPTSRWGSDGKLTTVAAGIYCVTSWVQYEANSTNMRQLWIEHNASTAYGKASVAAAGSTVQTSLSTSALIELAVDDTVRNVARQNSGSTLDVNHFISMFRVST